MAEEIIPAQAYDDSGASGGTTNAVVGPDTTPLSTDSYDHTPDSTTNPDTSPLSVVAATSWDQSPR